jgi:HEAT repeat protein
MLKDPAAIEPLTQLLGDTEPAVRLAAVDALAAYRQPELLICFVLAAQDADATVRACGVAGMGTCGNAKAVPQLLKALKDENSGVRAAATEAVATYGELARPGVNALLQDDSADTRAAAIQALGALGHPASIPNLIPLLTDVDPVVCSSATRALARFGKAGTQALLPLFESDEPLLRARAAEILGRMKAVEAQPSLETLLMDPDSRVRLWAVYALGELPNPPDAAIERALLDPDTLVRAEAARVIGVHKKITQARALIDMTIGGAPRERIAAHAALCVLAGKDYGATPEKWQAWLDAL